MLIALGIGLAVALWQANEARDQAARTTALNTFVLGLIQQFDPRASQASKAADLALLSSIERRIDAEFKGGADQLLQLRVTVGNAYRERGQLAAARRVYRRAIVEAETTLPANDVGLLKARVARAWFAIADDEALQSIDTTIELLRQSGPAGIEPLIDALLARVDSWRVLTRRPGMTWDSVYADSREAYDLAVRHFGAGGAQQLRAARTPDVDLVRLTLGASVRRRIEQKKPSRSSRAHWTRHAAMRPSQKAMWTCWVRSSVRCLALRVSQLCRRHPQVPGVSPRSQASTTATNR